MDILETFLKFILAIALGGIIGLEREASQKPAGLRTHILICVSASMMMVLSRLLLAGKGDVSGDLLRIAAAVITGMGFIGAGTIIQAQGSVHGLTTAATLWTVAGLGQPLQRPDLRAAHVQRPRADRRRGVPGRLPPRQAGPL